MRTGGKTIKNVSGYDLTRLMVASEGTLGIVTEIALKINPKPTVNSPDTRAYSAITIANSSGLLIGKSPLPDFCSDQLTSGRTPSQRLDGVGHQQRGTAGSWPLDIRPIAEADNGTPNNIEFSGASLVQPNRDTICKRARWLG